MICFCWWLFFLTMNGNSAYCTDIRVIFQANICLFCDKFFQCEALDLFLMSHDTTFHRRVSVKTCGSQNNYIKIIGSLFDWN